MTGRTRLRSIRLVHFEGSTDPPEDLPESMEIDVSVAQVVVEQIEDHNGRMTVTTAIELAFRLLEAGDDRELDNDDEDDESDVEGDDPDLVGDDPLDEDEDEDALVYIAATFLLTYGVSDDEDLRELATKRAILDVWSPWLAWLHVQLAAFGLAPTDLAPRPSRKLISQARTAYDTLPEYDKN